MSSFFDKVFSMLGSEVTPLDSFSNNITQLNQDGIFDNQITKMLQGVLAISNFRARDLMVPRAHIDYFMIDDDIYHVLDTVLENGYSRYPVLSSEEDDCYGLLFSRDLLRFLRDDQNLEGVALRDIIKPIKIVPESKKVLTLLQEFQQNHTHLALVVNEFGEISGLITIEDILEEIVGEIEDEFDTVTEEIRQVSKTTYEVLATTALEEFNEFFYTELSTEEFDTIGGYIINDLGYVPQRNEIIELAEGRLTLRIVQANTRQILKVRVRENFEYKVGDQVLKLGAKLQEQQVEEVGPIIISSEDEGLVPAPLVVSQEQQAVTGEASEDEPPLAETASESLTSVTAVTSRVDSVSLQLNAVNSSESNLSVTLTTALTSQELTPSESANSTVEKVDSTLATESTSDLNSLTNSKENSPLASPAETALGANPEGNSHGKKILSSQLRSDHHRSVSGSVRTQGEQQTEQEHESNSQSRTHQHASQHVSQHAQQQAERQQETLENPLACAAEQKAASLVAAQQPTKPKPTGKASAQADPQGNGGEHE